MSKAPSIYDGTSFFSDILTHFYTFLFCCIIYFLNNILPLPLRKWCSHLCAAPNVLCNELLWALGTDYVYDLEIFVDSSHCKYFHLVRLESKTRKEPFSNGSVLTVLIGLLKVLSVKNIPYTLQIF